MDWPELRTLVLKQRDDLKDVLGGLAQNKPELVAAGLMTLLAGLATGHPEVSILTPLAQEGVRRAFAGSATGRLKQALTEFEAEDAEQAQQDAMLAALAEAIEALLGQALIQLVRVQHQLQEALRDDLATALGGLREDLAEFREEFGRKVPDVRVDLQQVLDVWSRLSLPTTSQADIPVAELGCGRSWCPILLARNGSGGMGQVGFRCPMKRGWDPVTGRVPSCRQPPVVVLGI